MSANTLLALQSLGIVLQMLNGGIASVTHNGTVALFLGAAVGGFQYFLQHVGNQSEPNK